MADYVVGIAVGMEYVNDVMRMSTSWTTAACLHGKKVVEVQRVHTTANDVFIGVKEVLHKLLQKLNSGKSVTRVTIATPQILNGIHSDRISPVAVVRLCGPSTQSLLPFIGFPTSIKSKIDGGVHLLNGGYEFNIDPGTNEDISPVNVEEVLQCIDSIRNSGQKHVVICGVYSPDKCDQEYKVAELFNKYCPDVQVTQSHQVIKKNGFLQRENASILNSSLKDVLQDNLKAFSSVLHAENVHAPFYLVENDQGLTSDKDDSTFPINTFFSVQACTMRAAAFLTAGMKELNDAIVIDIGGTVTKASVLNNMKPLLQTITIQVAGIQAYNNSVYVVPCSLGLFSIVHYSKQSKKKVDKIGPDCVATYTDALVFGGTVLTCLDIAVAAKLIDMGDAKKVKKLDHDLVKQSLKLVRSMIENLIDMTKEKPADIPVILTGLGSVLIDDASPLKGTSTTIKPKYFQVADAIGAALLEPSSPSSKDSHAPQPSVRTYLHHEIPRLPRSLLSSQWYNYDIQGMTYEGVNGVRMSKLHGQNIARRAYERLNRGTVMAAARAHSAAQNGGKVGEYQPNINNESGEWLISQTDLDYLSIGVGILGSGGGGSPQLAHMLGSQQLDKGKKISVIAPERLGSTNQLKGLASGIAYMGDPKVVLEKLPNGLEGADSLKCMLDLYTCTYTENQESIDWTKSWKPAGTVTSYTCNNTCEYIQEFPTVFNPPVENKLNLVALMPLEIGGMNGFQPLVVSSMSDLPVLDCDGMGRAIPELQMYGPSIYGDPLYPATLSGYKGERCVTLKNNTPHDLEMLFRDETVKMGSVSVVTLGPLDVRSVNEHTVKYTISQAWNIGKRVIDARANSSDPIQSILDCLNGQLLIRNGKVTDVFNAQAGGFETGRYTVVAEAADKQQSQNLITIDFQNENLVAWKGDPINQVALVCCPDLISLVDELGNPITTDSLHYGLRVSVLAIPCSPLMRTQKALAKCGPRALGYNFDYTPIGKYAEPTPIAPLPKPK